MLAMKLAMQSVQCKWESCSASGLQVGIVDQAGSKSFAVPLSHVVSQAGA
jgi:hypothetical protein